MAWPRFWRILQFAIGALLVGLAVRSLVVNWSSLKAQGVDWRISPAWITSSVLIVFAVYAVLIEAWRRLVVSMGAGMSFGTAARIWFVANLGKYVPGKVWAIAGAAVLAQRSGVDPSAAVAGAITVQALALASGAVVIGFTAQEAFQAIGRDLLPLAAIVVALALTGVSVLAFQPLLDRINRLLPSRLPPLLAVRAPALALGFGANTIAWVGYGIAFLCLARGLLPDIQLSLGQAVGVFTCSYLIGFIALFAPGGLGPRESVFLLLLAGDIGLEPAAGLALASRLLLTGTEVLPAVPLLLRRASRSSSPVGEL